EVMVGMQKRVAVLNAARRNQRVTRFAHCHPEAAQLPIVVGSLHSHLASANRYLGEVVQRLARQLEVLVTAKALQHLRQHQIADGQSLAVQKRVQQVDLWCRCPAEEVDPNARVDKNHLSALIASRSPSQSSFPRSCRACACLPSCTRVRKPSSTASRFVL